MATMGGFDMGFGNIPPNAVAAFGSITMDGDEYVRCTRCSYGGCDVRVSGCGCTLHARCLVVNENGPLPVCPNCEKPTHGLVLFPMSFREIDEAHRTASALPKASKNRGRKRKGGAGELGVDDKGSYISERRTGRWTTEEMAYCDKVMAKFESGEIPVANGVKLNEFLGNMLKSKQSRLTKKMKNAKLSSKTFQRKSGVLGLDDAREFSELEEAFFHAVTDHLERAEIKFHMQKEWREQFSRVCATVGQPLDADSWLSSVEEMDRRASQAKDAARMAKRKLMMGVALRTDSRNPDHGVFIEKTEAEVRASGHGHGGEENHDDHDVEDELLNMLAEEKTVVRDMDVNGKSSLLHSAPFLAKVTAYLQRHGVPFEHIDVWVPSFVPETEGDQRPCRLCYAGSATTEKLVGEDGKSTRPLTTEEQFNLFAFGDYSQKFSFDVGCGLPGRVYESGRPTWEQSVHNAPHNHFERCGGAFQWGIKTVVGIPIASPSVGRIVVTLYSCFDRPKDEDIVARLSEEFTRLTPAPKWKLVVDIGEEDTTAATYATAAATTTSVATAATDHYRDMHDMAVATTVTSVAASTAPVPGGRDTRAEEVVSLLGEFMPSDPNSPLAPYVSGFMSLRLLLLRSSLTAEEEELSRTILDSFSSYSAGGRARSDIALMLARDYMFLGQQQPQQQGFLGMQATVGLPAAAAPAASNGAGLSLFGLPSTSSSLQNSPALAPIPVPGSVDSMSIVSN